MMENNDTQQLIKSIPEELSIVPLNDAVVYPYMLIPMMVTDENLIRVVDEALASNKIVGVFTQKNKDVSNPGPDDIYHTGCAVLIQKMARFPDGHIRIIGHGLARVKIVEFTSAGPSMRARIKILTEKVKINDRVKAIVRNVKGVFSRIFDVSDSYPA